MTVTPNNRKLDSPSPWDLLRGLRREFTNWYVLGPLTWVALPSRCPPQGGIRSLAARMIRVEIRGGYRADCRIDEFFSFIEVFVLREYEPPRIGWTSLKTIVDVGANVGAATLWFARKSPNATVFAVEPSRSAVASLRRNVDINRLGDRVRIIPVAVAESSGTVELHQNGSSVFATTGALTTASSQTVPALSLHDLFESEALSEIDILKLDCEGAEFEVLDATDDRVLRRSRHIIGEYHANARWSVRHLVERLDRAGFEVRASGGSSVGLFRAERKK